MSVEILEAPTPNMGGAPNGCGNGVCLLKLLKRILFFRISLIFLQISEKGPRPTKAIPRFLAGRSSEMSLEFHFEAEAHLLPTSRWRSTDQSHVHFSVSCPRRVAKPVP